MFEKQIFQTKAKQKNLAKFKSENQSEKLQMKFKGKVIEADQIKV